MYDFLARAKSLGLPSWYHTSYVTDWAVGVLFYGLTTWIKILPVFERDFMVDDPAINHCHTKQRVNHILLSVLALYTPYLCIFAIGVLNRSLINLHHGCLGLWLAVSSQSLIVNALKNRVGRLRPDFLARCKWDTSLKACTGKPGSILDGRRSFPSGHSSLSFAGLTFLSLYLGTHICAFRRQSAATRVPNLLRSMPLRIFITVSPLAIATWIAVTRLEDYRHHKEDVITGGSIGAICAYVSYNMYWDSPFTGNPGPRSVYADNASENPQGYELARMDEPHNIV